MTSPFGGSRVQVKPPERGVFALDHEGECKSKMKEYLKCLKVEKQDHYACKTLSRAYLQCRMDRGLMAEDNLDHLGLGKEDREYKRIETDNKDSKESKGFMAGLNVKTSRWFQK